MLKRLNRVEAKILQYSCSHAPIYLFANGLIMGAKYLVPFDKIVSISETSDKYIIDGSLDHLIKIGLLRSDEFDLVSGFMATDNDLQAGISPSALGLSLFYKASASPLSLLDFYKNQLIDYKNDDGVQGSVK